jgi:hypothetical protein
LGLRAGAARRAAELTLAIFPRTLPAMPIREKLDEFATLP